MSTRTRPSTRYRGLDGLRGLAAFVVLIFHCLLISPALAHVYEDGGTATGAIWWLTYSPLHLFWAGTEAVAIFFVLSGFVLTLPFLDATRRPRWRSYYPQRLVRLYVPVGASLALAVLSYIAVDHRAAPGMSWWLGGHDIVVNTWVVGHEGLLVLGSGWLNSVLWSLRWEVLFSLALPAAVFVCVRAGRLRPILLVASIVLIGVVSAAGIPSAGYLVMFAVGALLAAEQERIRRLSSCGSPLISGVVAVAAVVLVLAQWWPGGRNATAPAFITVGAALLLVLFASSDLAVSFGTARPVHWLGTRSFSLYLVHEPIVVCTALLLHTDNPAQVMVVAMPCALVATAIFYRLVERPSHRFARATGRFCDSTVRWPRRRRAAPPVERAPAAEVSGTRVT